VAELVAKGADPDQKITWSLPPDRPLIVGRETAADLRVPWDAFLSRRHVEVEWAHGRLAVRRLSTAENPLYFEGQPVESCILRPGQHCVIGTTILTLKDDAANRRPGSEPAIDSHTFSRESLNAVRYRDPDRRIDVLSHLPEVIWGARSGPELDVRLVNLLLAGVSQAEAAAVVSLDVNQGVRLMHGDRRRETAGSFRPSTRLVMEALVHRQASVLHVWEGSRHESDYTLSHEFDWAFCTPVSVAEGDAWGLYLAGTTGRLPADNDSAGITQLALQADVKFVELVAQIVHAVHKLNRLERQQSRLRQFLPPVVTAALRDSTDSALLTPRECHATILFGDLRGFSRRTELERDQLMRMLDRVSHALGVMTEQILGHGGVVGDYHGDAAMGFWGWPVASPEASRHAIRAALALRSTFHEAARRGGSPLEGFEMAMGLASGKSVAGLIGVKEHVKVTVYGPPVNLASRLEGMTRTLRVPILIDDSLAEIVRNDFSPMEARTRRLARVIPFGMDAPVMVNELLPGEADYPELTAEHLETYDAAVQSFIAGDWNEAYRALRSMPPGDRAQDFLMLQIARANRVAPPDWTGVVRLESK
jgi:adenylate cyclase